MISPLSTSLVLLRLIAELIAVEAIVESASLVGGDGEYDIGQVKSDLLEVERHRSSAGESVTDT